MLSLGECVLFILVDFVFVYVWYAGLCLGLLVS